jgi:serine/threonine-protein kinase
MISDEPLYCGGCNEWFSAKQTGGATECEECGQPLVSLDAPTRPAGVSATGGGSRSGDDLRELVGRVLGGCRIEEFLGSGGTAHVFRAFHLGLERPCALKVLSPGPGLNHEEWIELFVHEARAAASLVHPNIVTVHNVGEERGYHFIELEYVEGRSLDALLARRERLDVRQATALMAQAVSGLAEAHDSGIVHRDVKPGNILVSARGEAKLSDFGLAKRVSGWTSRRGDRDIAGTPHFMAPELFEGSPASPRTDVYAAGVSFYRVLTGQLPFTAPSLPALASMHKRTVVPDPSALVEELPHGAKAVVSACLGKKPAARFEDGSVLAQELRALLGSLRSLDELVDAAVRGIKDLVDVHRASSSRFEIRVHLPGARTQTVNVERVEGAIAGRPMVRVSSLCAPVNESYFRRALELNARLAHGSVAIEDHEGEPYFVMANIYPWDTCDPVEVRESVLEIAEWADAVEDTLTSRDEH